MKRTLPFLLLPLSLTWALNAGAQCPDSTAVVFSSDFEVNDGGLVQSGYLDWQWGIIGTALLGTSCTSTYTNPIGAHSGTRGWGTVLADCYANSGDTSVVRLTVDLSDPAYTSARLRYWSWWEVFTNFDYIFIRVNGQRVYLNDSQQLSTTWQQQTVDLTPFLGQSTVNITFHLYATTVVNKAGWYLDDMEVTACLPSSGGTGIAGAGAPGIRVWPNPAEGALHVQSPAGGPQEWRLIDMTGRIAAAGTFAGGGTWTVPTEGLTGPHVLEVRAQDRTWRERVVLR